MKKRLFRNFDGERIRRFTAAGISISAFLLCCCFLLSACSGSGDNEPKEKPVNPAVLEEQLGFLKENVEAAARDTLDSTAAWFSLEINDAQMLNGLPGRMQRLEKALGGLKQFTPEDFRPEERRRLMKLAYVAMSRNMSAYHCARARAFLPDKTGGGACAPYDFEYTESLINSLLEKQAKEKETAEKAPAPSRKGPNIILIVIDTLREDYFQEEGAAPFLHRLAQEGLAFRNAFSCGSATHTSVASLVTGVNPLTHGMLGYSEWDNSLLITPIFREAGYQTTAISANSVITPDMGFAPGFERFAERYWVSADVLNLEIASWLYAGMDKNKSQFMYIHYVDPHGPYFSPDTFNFKTRKTAGWPAAVIPGKVRDEYNKKGIDARGKVSEQNVEEMKNNYRDEIVFMDARLKDAFTVMRDSGLLNNALVVITSDHGEEFLEHGGVKHSWTLYGEVLHVPLILWGNIPGGWREGFDRDRLVSLMDVAPMILDFAALQAPPYLEGSHPLETPSPSFRSAATQGKSPGSFTEACDIVAIIRDRWKLISCPSSGEYRLFDLESDPGEQEDVSSIYPDVTSIILNDLKALEEGSAPAPEPGKQPAPEKLKQLKSLGYIE